MEEIARRIKGSHFQEENDGIRKIIGFDRATFSRSLNEEGRIEKMERKMPNMQFGRTNVGKGKVEDGSRKQEHRIEIGDNLYSKTQGKEEEEDGGSKPEKKKTTEHGIRKMETFVRKHR